MHSIVLELLLNSLPIACWKLALCFFDGNYSSSIRGRIGVSWGTIPDDLPCPILWKFSKLSVSALVSTLSSFSTGSPMVKEQIMLMVMHNPVDC